MFQASFLSVPERNNDLLENHPYRNSQVVISGRTHIHQICMYKYIHLDLRFPKTNSPCVTNGENKVCYIGYPSFSSRRFSCIPHCKKKANYRTDSVAWCPQMYIHRRGHGQKDIILLWGIPPISIILSRDAHSFTHILLLWKTIWLHGDVQNKETLFDACLSTRAPLPPLSPCCWGSLSSRHPTFLGRYTQCRHMEKDTEETDEEGMWRSRSWWV